jgi:hypothetical protein
MTTIDTIRKSVDETLAILKWNTSNGVPANMPAGTDYDHAGILAVVVTTAWNVVE